MATSRAVDFSNVKEQGNFNTHRVPAGDYMAKIVKVEDAEAKDGIFQYLFTIKLEKFSQYSYPYYCKLQENQLWKLRNIFIAAGKTVPKSRIKVDPNQIVGKFIGVTMEDDEYEGKEKSVVQNVFPAAELPEGDDSGVEDDDEEVTLDDDEDAEDVLIDDEEEVAAGDEWDAITDRLELRKALKKVAPDVKTSTAMSDDDIRDLIRANSASDEDELIEDEEEEEAPAPKAAVKKAPAKKAATVTDDELEELDIDDM